MTPGGQPGEGRRGDEYSSAADHHRAVDELRATDGSCDQTFLRKEILVREPIP